jgi:hypothetical protein
VHCFSLLPFCLLTSSTWPLRRRLISSYQHLLTSPIHRHLLTSPYIDIHLHHHALTSYSSHVIGLTYRPYLTPPLEHPLWNPVPVHSPYRRNPGSHVCIIRIVRRDPIRSKHNQILRGARDHLACLVGLLGHDATLGWGNSIST